MAGTVQKKVKKAGVKGELRKGIKKESSGDAKKELQKKIKKEFTNGLKKDLHKGAKKGLGKGKSAKKDDSKPDLNAMPMTYKFAAEALKIMSEKGGSAGSIVVNKFKSYNVKHIYALVMNTLKNIKMIKKLIHETKLHKKVPLVDDPFLLEILVGDLVFGRGLKALEQNSSAAAVLSFKDAILKQKALLAKDEKFAPKAETNTPKYLRINPLQANMAHVISQLKAAGLTQVEYNKSNIKFKKFINKFKGIQDNEFMLDFHFPDDLIILKAEGAERLKRSDLIKKGKAMLQDKASFMAVEAMDVEPGQRVIDGCCAPGAKTSLIAGKMKNKGKIFAFDVDKGRFLIAKRMFKVYGVNNVTIEVQDFSKVKLNRLLKTHNLKTFDSILLDPSCSGSGIQSRVDYQRNNAEAGRLKKLQAFQVALLKHAIKAKASKSIVYCTCSISIEENEQVIEMALNESGVKDCWEVQEVLPYWQHRGQENYEFGKKCLRSDESDLTNGFFIAKLQLKETESSS